MREGVSMENVNIEKTTDEIIFVLNNNNVPIGLFDFIFEHTKKKAEDNTIPYRPKRFNIMDVAMSDTTDNATEPKG
jgi:hypothetical protein